jgi:glycerol-3-phosphate dehydrogenase
MPLNELPENWDLIIIGGGITGAGILREATRMSIKVLLVEQRDFAWGTSSRLQNWCMAACVICKKENFF